MSIDRYLQDYANGNVARVLVGPHEIAYRHEFEAVLVDRNYNLRANIRWSRHQEQLLSNSQIRQFAWELLQDANRELDRQIQRLMTPVAANQPYFEFNLTPNGAPTVAQAEPEQVYEDVIFDA